MNDPGPVRFSHLRAYGRSGAHGFHARFCGEQDETYAMERGTAVHAILFGNKKVCGYPGPTRRGREYEAFAAEHADYEILTGAEYDKARRMADAVLASKVAMDVLKGDVEQTLLFKFLGLPCRSTPDIRGADYITELKTCATSDPARFVWHAQRMHYHAQMRMEQIACFSNGYEPVDCWIVAVESSEPFPVTVFHLEPRALEVGEKLLMMWAERLRGCELSGVWPPYVTCPVPLDVPDEDNPIEFEDEQGSELSIDEKMLLGSQI